MTSFFLRFANFFNARVVLIAILSAGAAATFGYMRGAENTRNAIQAELATEAQVRQDTYEAAMRAAAEEIAKIKILNTTIKQELEREIRTEPVYLDCRHSDDAKRLLDAILTGEAPAESIAGFELPSADPAE